MSETEKKTRKLHPSRFKVAQYATNRWTAIAEAGTTYEEILRSPSYWSHIVGNATSRLKPCDIIEVHTDDLAFYAELYVVAVGKLEASVCELRFTKLEKPAPLSVDEFYIQYAGPHHKHRIVRVSDGEPVDVGFGTEQEAAAAAARAGRKIVPKPDKAAA